MNNSKGTEQDLKCIFTDDTLTDININNILEPDKARPDIPVPVWVEQDFILQHPYPRPLLDNQLEFFSSKEERIQVARPRYITDKRVMQKRMRIIILVDIVLFIVILGVIYPALLKLQSSGRLNDYRFSLSQSLDQENAVLNIVTKIEQLARDRRNTEFTIRISYQGRQLLQEIRPLPDSPVSYALFLIPSQQLQPDQTSRSDTRFHNNRFDIVVQIGPTQKQFFLPLPQFSPAEFAQ